LSEADFSISRHSVEQYRDRVLFCPDLDKGKEVLRSLASLKRGEAWVWSPEIGFGPKCIQFPLFATYDSFAAALDERLRHDIGRKPQLRKVVGARPTEGEIHANLPQKRHDLVVPTRSTNNDIAMVRHR
jgi:hypothetical protein